MKFFGRFFIGFFLIISFVTPVFAGTEQEPARFTIGSNTYSAAGQTIKMDVSPYIENGRTYVPIRYIANALGIPDENIEWNPATQSIYLSKDSVRVKLLVNGSIMWRNDVSSLMDVSPQIRYNRTFLPARFVAEAFGSTVNWYEESKSIVIFSSNGTNSQSSVSNSTPSSSDTLKYDWEYKGDKWRWQSGVDQAKVEEVLEYYKTLPHPHRTQSDYVLTYCMDENDNRILKPVVDSLKAGAEKESYNQYDTVGMVIAFVQSFTYVSDSVSTGFDEYPRYPVETLLSRKGDCEDTSILTATLLRELGYGTALIFFQSHCAVGIKGSDTLPGSYFTVKGTRYYYVETTAKGWTIGKIPGEYQDQKATVLPLP